MAADVHRLEAVVAADAVFSCTTGAPGLRSCRSRRMASGSAARLARVRSWRARAPKSCASAITAIGGAVSVRPCRSGATVSARRAPPAANASQLSTVFTSWAWARSISCSTSRRPGESAASSTRPSKARRNSSSGANGCSARTSSRSSRGAVVGKLRTPGDSPCSSVSALKASRVMLAKGLSRASSSAGSRNNSAGLSTGRSMSWRRSS